MTEYPKDTSAAVVVLWDFHEVQIALDADMGCIRKRVWNTERVKILKESGKSYADGVEIISTKSDDQAFFKNLDVKTYNYENGKMVVTKMPKSGLIVSKYNENYDKYAFAAVGVKVGSVVEISYETETNRYYEIPDCYLQRSVPVNYGQYVFGYPDWMGVTKVSRGYEDIHYQSEIETGIDIPGLVANNSQHIDRYYVTDAPALKEEELVQCIDDYRTSVSYDINSVALGRYTDLSTTWEKVAGAVVDSEIWGKIKSPCKFKEEVDAVIKPEMTDEQKVEAITVLVQSKIRFDGNRRLVPGKIAEALSSGSSSNANINAIAGSAMRYAGLNVKPVLVRSRKEGRLLEHRPSLYAFDSFILMVEDKDGKKTFVDASNEYGYLNVVGTNMLIPRGFVVDERGGCEWADLTSLSRNAETTIFNAAVTPDGTVRGHGQVMVYNIPSMHMKAARAQAEKEEDFIKMLEDGQDIEISDLKYENAKKYGRTSKLDFEFERQCTATADKIIIDPFIIKAFSYFDFKQENRKFPVDFHYKTSETYTFTLEIPEGYVVEQLPKLSRYVINIPSSFAVISGVSGSKITIVVKSDLRTLQAFPGNYADLRAYWSDIQAAYKQVIILKKVQ